MFYSTITSRGQITIPVQFREILGIQAGQKVEFILKDDQIIIMPINKDISSLKGILPKPTKTMSCDDMDRLIKEETNDRAGYKHTG